MGPFLIFGTLACILVRSRRWHPSAFAKKFKPQFAADPIVGTWKLNVAKSKFSASYQPTAKRCRYTTRVCS